jgi:hypothetical protein
MKLCLTVVTAGLMSMIALAEYRLTPTRPLPDPAEFQRQLEEDMNEKFSLRDNFREKGNSGRYIKTHYQIVTINEVEE